MMPESPTADVWKNETLAKNYLAVVRKALPFAREQLALMLRVLDYGPTPARVLDLGCGDGRLAAAMLAHYPHAQAVLVDFSPPMLAAARRRMRRFGTRVSFRCLDYADPGWGEAVRSDAPFGAIVSGYSIHHQPDARKQALYREIFSLLAPGGFFYHIEHVAPHAPLISQLLDDTFVELILAGLRRRGEKPDPAVIRQAFVTRQDKAANLLTPVETQCAWLRDIGFSEVDIYFKYAELASFAGRRPEY